MDDKKHEATAKQFAESLEKLKKAAKEEYPSTLIMSRLAQIAYSGRTSQILKDLGVKKKKK